jgi:hypothetical protein
MKLFKKKKQPSLLALQIAWFNNSSWLDRLFSYQNINRYLYR